MAKSIKKEEENVTDLENIKKELKDYIDITIKNGFTDELEKSNRRLIREKNKKLIFKDIIILILLVVIGLLIYLLYSNKVFNKYFSDTNDKETTTVIEKEEKEEKKEEKKLTLEELIEKHSYLLDKVVISENSDYIEDYYSGNITNELKHYISLNNIDFKELSKEDDYNIIETSLIEKEYLELFSGKYEPVSFKYNSNKVRYLNKMESFVTDKVLEKNESNIKREIISVKEEGKKVIITSIEGLMKDDKLYKVDDSKKICDKKCNLKDYEKDLAKVTYTFVDGKLDNIK